MTHLTNLKIHWSLLMDWLATPIVWLFWPIRKRWLGRWIANFISMARLPLLILILTKLPNADVAQTFRLILLVGAVQLLDGLDGAAARGLCTDNALGGAIDGGVDKINTLLFICVLIWQLLQNPANRVLVAVSCFILLFVVVLQVLIIEVNRERKQLTETLGKNFSSRLPAQVNFVASMLIIAAVWLVGNSTLAALMLLFGSLLMMFLSGWVLEDYSEDLQQLQFEQWCPSRRTCDVRLGLTPFMN